MSSLWETNDAKKFFKERKGPSPNYNCSAHSLAQDDIPLKSKVKFRKPIKRISLFTFHGIQGSMTVEAAVVLPLILFFFLNLMSAVEMLRLHGKLGLALREIGNQLSVYGYEYNVMRDNHEEKEGLLDKLGGIAFSYVFVKNRVVEYLGKDYLDNSPLTHGADGLNFLECRFFEEGDTIDLTVTYQVSPEVPIPGFPPFRMSNRYFGRAWTGYDVTPDGGQEGMDCVYVTKNGRVYHESPECSYIKLKIEKVTLEAAMLMTNEWGERYTKCWRCGDGVQAGLVSVTSDGVRYHSDAECPGLKRTIYPIPRSQACSYRPCSRCAQ